MAKNVSGLNYETIYDEIPYHIKSSIGLPITSHNLTNDHVRFFMKFQEVISAHVFEALESERENIRVLAEEMSEACDAILKETK